MGDQLKGLLVSLILGAILMVVLFGIVRRMQRTWWIWGAVVTTCFMTLVVLIAPVFIVPIFNKVTLLDDPKVTQPILSLARANGISAHDVFEMDASRQTCLLYTSPEVRDSVPAASYYSPAHPNRFRPR